MRIKLDNIEYFIDNTRILHAITCAFTTGISYIIGKNGVGKSALLKLITTAIRPSSGEITFTRLISDDGGVYRKQLSTEEVRKIIGFMPQHFMGHSEMTIERYLTYIAFHKGIPRQFIKPTIKEWLQETHLEGLRKRKLKNLSGGQRQKVGLIQALINQPRICILDEPFEGLDTKEKQYFNRIIERLSFHSIVIISTHLLEELDLSANDWLFYLEEEKLSLHMSTNEVLNKFNRD